MYCRAIQRIDAIDTKLARLKGPNPAGDKHGFRVEYVVGRRLNLKITVLLFDFGYFLTEVHTGIKGLNLLHQVGDELLAAANRYRRNIVNRFVWV